jgi:PAS domain S-box-containing protein
MGGLIWRYINHRIHVNKLSLEYDLAQERQRLKLYSEQLEYLVAERTKELKKSETMLRSLFEQATDGILIMNDNGIITDANEKACEIYGFDKESLIGTNIEFFETEKNKHLWAERKKRLLNGESLFFETQHQRKDGSIVSIEISAKAIELESGRVIQAFCRDVTEKKRLQQQLLQSQKLESIGQLAGGIAHDFNNFLTVIMGYSELLSQNPKLDERSLHMIKQITRSASQASQIVEKLLKFSRRGDIERTKVNLNNIINETHEMLERFLPREVKIRKELHEPLPLVEADPNQMEQVLMNLVINAKDAMPNGGTITINTALTFLDKDEAGVANIRPGEYVKVSISDTGKGIPEENLPHIFEPFFTTKGKDKGTGLGLAMVYGIVKEHGGHITVKSKLNKGTTFEVYLPVNTISSF